MKNKTEVERRHTKRDEVQRSTERRITRPDNLENENTDLRNVIVKEDEQIERRVAYRVVRLSDNTVQRLLLHP